MQQPFFPVVTQRAALEFRCSGPACEDTCCKVWPVDVDDDTLKKYKRQRDLRNTTEDSPHGTVMRLHPQSRECVTYQGGLCGIQSKYGEDYLSQTCYFYPRNFRRFGNRQIMALQLSCPEAARILLRSDDAFERSEGTIGRTYPSEKDFQPPTMTEESVETMHRALVTAVLDPAFSPERQMGKLILLSEALEDSPLTAWEAIILHHAKHPLLPRNRVAARPEDAFRLFAGIVRFAVKDSLQYTTRFYRTLRDMELALKLRVHWEEGTVAVTDESEEAWRDTQKSWARFGAAQAPALRRWLAAQMQQHVFPFTGHSVSARTRALVLALNFATVRQALICACHLQNGEISEADRIRVVQTIARTIDHMVDVDGFFDAYHQPQKHSENRLRAMVGDIGENV